MTIAKIKSDAAQALIVKQERLLRGNEVQELTNIGKTKRNELIRKGLFPAPIKVLNEHQLPGRTSYWLSSSIDQWLHQQVEAHRARLAQIANDGLGGWLNRAVQNAAEARHV